MLQGVNLCQAGKTLLKYLSAGILEASLYNLVLLGKLDPMYYYASVIVLFGAIGIHGKFLAPRMPA